MIADPKELSDCSRFGVVLYGAVVVYRQALVFAGGQWTQHTASGRVVVHTLNTVYRTRPQPFDEANASASLAVASKTAATTAAAAAASASAAAAPEPGGSQQWGAWELHSAMLTPRSKFGLAVVNDVLIAIGGEVFTATGAADDKPRTAITADVECYHELLGRWVALAPLPQPRMWCAAAVVADV